MKDLYFNLERNFEEFVAFVTKILGNSITFILACFLVLFWWISTLLHSTNMHQNIGDFIFGTTFLCLFIIQKSFNKYSALLHLKVNELISSHETANNSVMDTNQKTEKEIIELAREYIEKEEALEEANEKLIHKIEEANTDNQI